MAKVWVLDTDTKGTGANMVPLERVLRRGSDGAGAVGFPGFSFTKPQARPAPEPEPEPRRPHEFRVIDIMTRQALADHADARATVKTLEGVRSIVDVMIYVWDPERERWRMLTLSETQALWEYRGRTEDAPDVAESSPAR